VDEITDEGIDGQHAFGLELAQGNMERPLVGAGGAEAVIGQVDTFADTQAGIAEQQEDISAQIVAAAELLLQELILLGGERPWQSVGGARNILTQQQVRECRQMVGPRQFMEDGAQREQSADAGCGGQGRSVRPHGGHPSEDMGIAAQLGEMGNLWVFGAEIDEEVAHHEVVLGCAARRECRA